LSDQEMSDQKMSDQKMSDQTRIVKVANAYSVLLAGGTGTRLWPVSRKLYPKQLVSFIGKDSLVQSTVKRLGPVLDTDNIRIVCGAEHYHEIARHMEDIGVDPSGRIIKEPCGRNTAPAILLAVMNILKKDKDAVIFVFPADHVIRDIKGFHARVISAAKLAEMGHIVTFGIKPGYPETGYGYIEGGSNAAEGALHVKRFVEKPDLKKAGEYFKAGNFFWNSGMFAFKGSVMLEEFKIHEPEMTMKMDEILLKNDPPIKTNYEQLPDISIDYAIMERSGKVVVLPSDFGWSDIGSWKSLYDFLPKDENNNVIDGDVIAKDTKNCFIMGRERFIATNRISNMVVVETPDSVFVSNIEDSRDVKSIVEKLKEKGRKEYRKHKTVLYEWGSITLLEHQDGFDIDRIIVSCNFGFSIQARENESVHISVIDGKGSLIKDGKTDAIKKGDFFVITEGSAAEFKNSGDGHLCFIKVVVKK